MRYQVIRFGLVNVNSLLNKVDYVSVFARNYNLSVIAVGETHLVESISSSFVAIDGYSVVRGDVRGLIRKHGVCLYVSNNLQFEKVEIGCPNLAAVHLVHYDLWVLTFYRPPSNSDEENAILIGIMLEFCQGREVVILGDFNFAFSCLVSW